MKMFCCRLFGCRYIPLLSSARMKLGESDLQAVLGRVAELARRTLPGVVAASVTLVESDRAFTAAFAGQLALDLDETQYQEGFGPCLEVAQSAGTVTVPDMAAETRWRAFARQALAAGVTPPCRWHCLSGSRPRRTQYLRHPARRLRPGRHRAGPDLRRVSTRLRSS